MSSYPIYTTIPAAKNTPAQDQPKMQTNFANIAGFLAVNHTAPGTDNTAGTHTLVQFPKNVVPPAVDGNYTPVLFTNDQDGKQPTPNTLPQNELFFFSGSVLESLQQYIISSNGSTILFGGIILKWGVATIVSPTPPTPSPLIVTTKFESEFPNNCFCVYLTPSNARAVTIQQSLFVSDVAKENFKTQSSVTSQPATFYYLAIGN